MSMLQTVQDVETETLLYKYVENAWLCALDYAKNVVDAIEKCLDVCSGRNLTTTAVALSAFDKAETAFLWSMQAIRVLHDHHAQFAYSTAARLMLDSHNCLRSAVDALEDRDRTLHKLWIAAAETTSNIATIVVLTMKAIRNTSVDAKIANQVSEARANADAAEVSGQAQRAARWRRSARLFAIADALQYFEPRGRNERFLVAHQQAKSYQQCLKLHIHVECYVAEHQAESRTWAASMLEPFRTKLDAMLETSPLMSDVESVQAEISTTQAYLRQIVWKDKDLKARLDKCTAKSSSHQHGSQEVAAAWSMAAQQTRCEIVALEHVTSAPDPHCSVEFREPTSAKWVTLASWMDELYDATVHVEHRCCDSSNEQMRRYFLECASLLRQLLTLCASLLSSPEHCLANFQRLLPAMNQCKHLAQEYTSTAVPLYETASQLRACVASGAEPADELTEVAACIDLLGDRTVALIQDVLAEVQLALSSIQSSDASLHALPSINISSGSYRNQYTALRDASIGRYTSDELCVLRIVNAQLHFGPDGFRTKEEAEQVTNDDKLSCASCAAEMHVLQRAITAYRNTAAKFQKQKTGLDYQYRAVTYRASALCTEMAACLQCAIDAAQEGNPDLLADDACAALEDFHTLTLLQNTGVCYRELPTLIENSKVCTDQLATLRDTELRWLWRRTHFYFLQATVLHTACDSVAMQVVLSQAQRCRRVTDIIARISNQAESAASPHASQGQHCLDKATSCCKEPSLLRIWLRLATLSPFALTSDMDCLIKAADLVEKDVRLLHFCHAQLHKFTSEHSAVQQCWSAAAGTLKVLISDATEVFLAPGISAQATAAQLEGARTQAHANVRNYIAVVHSCFIPGRCVPPDPHICNGCHC